MTFGRGINSGMLDKRIPTIAGLSLLVVGLVIGIVLLGQGTNVFAPRATPETTPKQIRVTNVSDTSFTISFATDETTPGFLKYGTEPKKISTQAPDDRDKLTGAVDSYILHHITVTGLQPATEYYYLLGTGSGSTFDNNGAPFTVKTAARGGTPSAAKTAYGSVSNEAGSPADGAIVYLMIDGVGDLSTLVKSSGSWAIPLSNARTKDGGAYAQLEEDQTLNVEVRGTSSRQQLKYQTSISKSQPVTALQFGKSPSQDAAASEASKSAAAADTQGAARQGALGELMDDNNESTIADDGLVGTRTKDPEEASESADEAGEEEPPIATILDLTSEEHQIVTTTQPTITGIVPPNVTINIEVHSETEIYQQLISNPDGTFSLNIEELGKTLEPGEHTVKYSYTDPDTGELVEKTQTFTVAPRDGVRQLAQADTSGARSTTPTPTPTPAPFGSGNPYPVGGTGVATGATPAATATPAARTTMPSTASGIPVSGSVGTTTALVIGGLFFLIAGGWSFWMSRELES
jgi:hypothetical protein